MPIKCLINSLNETFEWVENVDLFITSGGSPKENADTKGRWANLFAKPLAYLGFSLSYIAPEIRDGCPIAKLIT